MQEFVQKKFILIKKMVSFGDSPSSLLRGICSFEGAIFLFGQFSQTKIKEIVCDLFHIMVIYFSGRRFFSSNDINGENKGIRNQLIFQTINSFPNLLRICEETSSKFRKLVKNC